ncbi:yjeF C-terminal region, hydroxyethylthiazole kinase-related [Roseomonas rosea]|uniref:ADP-dependent (S)-NAD(P)H-hydrate dehydratase n=1 Tax=Muricoccus roseus TaxID=198092 RepID=A0A1M6NL28_9PROT|nr:NAD(P)H-hydrate dehydratase [Roseomonas rosea]SHJ96431.1 yjeF C-terminal region, hydroxyethylthiazole kinase-related [Roseomonas rosea]
MTLIDAAWLRAHPLPFPAQDDDKSQRGTVQVVGGCSEVPGAVLLAGEAALRAGAGKLRLATVRSMAPHLAMAMPEALVIALDETEDGCIGPGAARALVPRLGACAALLIGPGLPGEGAEALVGALLGGIEPGLGVVLDAGALSDLAARPEALRRHAGRSVVTPHAGEMASILGIPKEEVSADPLTAARRAAAVLGAVVAMKGGQTWVVAPDGQALFCDHGLVGLATSGSGDTLAGIVTGLLARGTPPMQATAWAVWLHAEAGHRLARRIGPLGFLARELLAEVPAVMADLSAR